MSDKKEPHEKMTNKNNGLSDTQEVLYPDDFKKADEAAAEQDSEKKENDNDK